MEDKNKNIGEITKTSLKKAMDKSEKIKIGKIIPNKSLWNKTVEYYKEYCSYVNAFNNANKE